jgi:hypothetical protein
MSGRQPVCSARSLRQLFKACVLGVQFGMSELRWLVAKAHGKAKLGTGKLDRGGTRMKSCWLGLSGHDVLRPKCPLMTQSGRRVLVIVI